ncbi:hypothetical protein [Frankia sp. Cr1]|uniref:hypothetical protein n=1 Tax=Frankia sp. Cr1 TaxID=3073931 RepID=UPI002AD58BBB|nr:hypothetical protein [Frankia sp. Cr1]
MTSSRLGQLAAERADGAGGRLGRHVDVFASGNEELRQVANDGALARSAPLGPSTETNNPRSWSEKGRSFILAPYW